MSRLLLGRAPCPLLLIACCLLLPGCLQPNLITLPDPKGGISAKESPMLTERVRAGKLPPLEQRLPQEPLVVTPYERPGEYGGTWRMMVDNPDLGMYKLIAGYAPLVRWRADCMGLEPGTAKRWEYNAEGTRLTLYLRKGIRWSDGVEFTSEDIAYWAKLSLERKQRVVRPFWSLVNGKDMQVETPDRYTIVFQFAGPNWYVPMHLATGFWWSDEYNMPKHYLQQFDPQHNPKYKDYSEFDRKNLSHFNPDRPTLWPWKLTRIEDGGYRMLFERNPYYYMTDPQGRQLPYIDNVIVSYVPDPQVRVLKILSGAIDAQFRLVELRDQGLYVKGQQRGGYRLIRWAEATGGAPSILINWDVEDPVLRALFRDVRFRKALSLAIDREKCNQVAWRGLGRPQQATVSRQSWHFQTPEGKKVFEDWANSYAAFDLKRANAYLDAMGLTKRDKDGYRLRPDGQRLSLLYDLPPQNTSNPDTDSALIVTDGWRQLGIEVILKNWPAAVYTLRQKLGKYMISMHGEAEMDLFTYPDWVFPTTDVYWHGKIGKWYKTKGKEGEAPTGVMKELLDIYARILNEKDIQKAHRLVLEAVKIHTDRGLFALGTTADLPILIIAKNNFRNIPMDSRVMGPWAPSGPGTSYPETFFFSSRPEDQTPAASAPQLSERGDSVPARGEAGRAP